MKSLLTALSKKREATTLFILLLLATLLVALPQSPAAAQSPDADRVSYASADGKSTIVSQRVALTAADFGRAGALDGLQAAPEGLRLAEGGSSQGVYLSKSLRSPLGFTTDLGSAWLADVPDGAAVTLEVRLSNDGETWAEWRPVPVEFYPTANGEYGGVMVWVNQQNLYTQVRLTLQANAAGASPLVRRLTLFFNDSSQGPSDADAVAAASAAPQPACLTCPAKPLVIPRTAWGSPPGQYSPYWPPRYQPVTHVVINHSATPNEAQD